MGLDIYVGTLTRYHRGDWETIVQRLSRLGELPPVEMRYQHGPPPPPPSEEEARTIVLTWREAIAQALGDQIPGHLDWDETTPDYFTDKPAHECWGQLLLWAAYSEHPDLPRPASFPATSFGEWEADPAYARCQTQDTSYPHLLSNTMWWLPCEFTVVFQAGDAAGVPRVIGSLLALSHELNALNAATWQADDATVATWYKRGTPDHRCRLEDGARFAFGLAHHLVSKGLEHRLPMLLDW